MDDLEELRVEIDPYTLDKEWTRQPDLIKRWGIKLADAEEKVERLKSELKITAAELNVSIRESPEMYGLDKCTEAAIANQVLVQAPYKQAVSKLNEARHELGIVEAACEALDHRRTALAKLSDLWMADYYSGTSRNVNKFEDTDEEAQEYFKRDLRSRGRRRRVKEAENDDD